MMAAFHGKTGAVIFASSYVLNVIRWALRLSCDVVDVTTLIGDVDAWSGATVAYAVGDIVSYTDDALYQCHVAHTSAAGKEPTETAWWTSCVGTRSKLAGYMDWTAEVEGYFDTDGLDPDLSTDFKDGDGADLVLHYQTPGLAGKNIACHGIVAGIRFSQTKEGSPTVVYDFKPSTNASRGAVEGDE